jgi:hypothetical protein
MRFVTVWPGEVGLRGWVRRAAAAAEDERDALLSTFLIKALVAASDADELGGGWVDDCKKWSVWLRCDGLETVTTYRVGRRPPPLVAMAEHGGLDVQAGAHGWYWMPGELRKATSTGARRLESMKL